MEVMTEVPFVVVVEKLTPHFVNITSVGVAC
jgi:hypothetical protein